MSYLKVSFLIASMFLSTLAISGGADGGGTISMPRLLTGEEFSFSCTVEIKTAHISFKQEIELSNSKNEYYLSLNGKGDYFTTGGDKLSSFEVEEQLSAIGEGAMKELKDAKIFVTGTKIASKFNLYISGKMQDYTAMPFLTTRRSFSINDKTIDSELLVSRAYETQEYGLTISCINNKY